MKAYLNTARERIDSIKIESYKRLGGGVFHFHSPIELLYVKKGEAKVWIGETETVIHQDEFAVVLSYETHSFLSLVDGGDYRILFISSSMCPEFIEAIRHKNAHNPAIRDTEGIESIKYAFLKLEDEGLNPIERKGYVNVILGTLLRRIELADARDLRDSALSTRLFFYINEHYKEELSVDMIAAAMGYGRQHLSKCFRTNFHMSITDYINTLRLKNAIVLMRDDRKSITECALESGFGSMRTFYRAFSDEFGCSPREYLKRDT